MNTILISGASGLLASEFIQQLFKAEPKVKVIAVSGSCDELNEKYENESRLSCCGWDELDKLPFQNISLVIHCAFARTEDGEDLFCSLERTKLLLSKTGPHKIPFIGISSRSVYGQNPNAPWTDSQKLLRNF